jgi:hypothetical protein
LLSLLSLVGVSARQEIICTIVRTYVAQKTQLPVLLLTLNEAAAKANYTIIFYIVDTDIKVPGSRFIQRAIVTAEIHYPNTMFKHVVLADFRPAQPTYGYEDTDLVLNDILGSRNSDERSCTYFLFTNGDNFYTPRAFTSNKPQFDKGVDVIAFHFVNRAYCLNPAFVRTRIDLGAGFFSRKSIERSGARFLPKGYNTPDIYASDWWFFDRIIKSSPNITKIITPDVVFIHM